MCEPDYNARLKEINIKPEVDDIMFRSCGGHIHMAWPGFELEVGLQLIAAMDLFLALPMLFLEPQTKRRELYGKASCIRLKEYGPDLNGIEYRTLSNYWSSSEELIRYVWNGIMKSIDFINSGKTVENWDEIAEIIDTNNLEGARNLINQYGVNLTI